MITVTNIAELNAALRNAKGGDTIVLASGDYGSLDLNNIQFSSYVTITSSIDGGAKFDDVAISNSSFIRIDGVHVDNQTNGTSGSRLVSVDGGSHDIEFVNSEVNGKVDGDFSGHYGLVAEDAKNVTFSNNYVHDIKNGGTFWRSEGLEVSDNTIDYLGNDSFKFIEVDGVLIENNIGAEHIYPSAGGHLDFIQFQGGDSSNIVIRGNVWLPGDETKVEGQGIFLADYSYSNVLIENNIIATGAIRGVHVSNGTNVIVRYNTLLDIDGEGSKATLIFADGEIYKNILGTYPGDSRLGMTDGNLYIQQNNPDGSYYYGDYYAAADKGFGIALEDLSIVEESLAEDYGAYARIAELLGEGSTAKPDGGTDDSSETDEIVVDPEVDDSTGTGTDGDDKTDNGTDTGTDTGTDLGAESGTGGGSGSDDLLTEGEVITVSSASSLISALKGATGGETIVLADGEYGNVTLSSIDVPANVTVTSATALGAKFDTLTISDSSNITFDGIHVDSPTDGARYTALVDIVDGSSNIAFVNSEINGISDDNYGGAYGLRVKGSTGVVVENSYIHDTGYGAVFREITDLRVAGNQFEYIGGDSMNFAWVEDVVIEANIGATVYENPDPAVHNDFIQFQGDSSGVVIRGNVLLLDESPRDSTAVVQGLFIKDGAYSDFLIEQNVLHTNTVNGIYIQSTAGTGDNINIVNNTVLSTTDITKWDNAQIRIVSVDGSYTVKNNVVDGVNDQVGTGNVTGNLILQWENPNGANHYSDVYASVGASGATIDDFAPAAGSTTTAGASEWISIIMGNTDDGSDGGASTGPDVDTGTDTGATDTGIVWSFDGPLEMSDAWDVVQVAHSSALSLDAMTIALSFNADTVSGRYGLLSKDAAYFGDGGHFTTYIDDGNLIVRVQDSSTSATFVAKGIEAGTDYDLQVVIGDGGVSALLDGVVIGSSDIDATWDTNSEYIQVGGMGWSSIAGKAGYTNAFDGTISGVTIFDGELSWDEVTALLGDGDDTGATPDTGTGEITEPDTSTDPETDLGTNIGTESEAKDPNIVLSLTDPLEVSSASDVFEFDHTSDFELDAVTVALSFNADSVSKRAGLISKDAKYFGDGGHFVSYIQKGELFVRVQDGDSSATFSVDGIKANTDYDLQVMIDEDGVTAMLNGEVFGTSDIDASWLTNTEMLQVGANGWASAAGERGYTDVFDGTISDVLIYDGILSPNDVDTLL